MDNSAFFPSKKSIFYAFFLRNLCESWFLGENPGISEVYVRISEVYVRLRLRLAWVNYKYTVYLIDY